MADVEASPVAVTTNSPSSSQPVFIWSLGGPEPANPSDSTHYLSFSIATPADPPVSMATDVTAATSSVAMAVSAVAMATSGVAMVTDVGRGQQRWSQPAKVVNSSDGARSAFAMFVPGRSEYPRRFLGLERLRLLQISERRFFCNC